MNTTETSDHTIKPSLPASKESPPKVNGAIILHVPAASHTGQKHMLESMPHVSEMTVHRQAENACQHP